MKDEQQGRSWWPLGIVAGLSIVAVANAIMITYALQNPSVRVSEDPYLDGLHYDEVIAERRASEALGWDVDIDVCATGMGETCEVALVVRDRSGAPVRGLTGSVDARRGDNEALDRNASFEELSDGRYLASVGLATGGLYELSIRLEGGPSPWVASFTELIGERHT